MQGPRDKAWSEWSEMCSWHVCIALHTWASLILRVGGAPWALTRGAGCRREMTINEFLDRFRATQ